MSLLILFRRGAHITRHYLAVALLTLTAAAPAPVAAQALPSFATAKDPGDPIEVTLGSHRATIPEHYFRHRTRPDSKTRIELEMQWPKMTPAPWPGPGIHGLDGADIIDITAITTEDIKAETLATIRQEQLRRIEDAQSPDAGPRDQGAVLFGLTPFYLDFERLRQAVAAKGQNPNVAANPLRIYNRDWYFAPRTREEPPTFIRCTPRVLNDGVHVVNGRLARSGEHNVDVLATCSHAFEIPKARSIVYLNYPRALLSEWQAFENQARRLLLGEINANTGR